MNIKPPKKEDLDVNITPLIDVVFLLLIFFMVSTTFKHENEITINLPESTSKSPPKEDNIIEIVSGKISVIELESLQRIMKGFLR